MLPAEQRQQIMDNVVRYDSDSINELMDVVGASRFDIRRDLNTPDTGLEDAQINRFLRSGIYSY